jgi:Fusaric acid resistance protein-like
MAWRRFELELFYQRLRDSFLINDPGLIRLRSAIRGTLTVGVSLIALWRFSQYSHVSMMLAFVGVMMAQMGAIAVTDAKPLDQKKTTLLVPVVASGSLILGVLVSHWHLVAISLLFAMTFIAIYVRRLGPRGAGLGLIAYFAYFASIFFKVPQESLSFVVTGIFIAGVVSYIVRFYLVPDSAMSTIEWSLSAYRAGIRRFIRAAERELIVRSEGKEVSTKNRAALELRMKRVNELALLSDDAIVNAGDMIPGSGALVRSLQGRVFDLELSARKIFESLQTLPPNEIRASLFRLAERMTELRSTQKALVAEEEAAVQKSDSKVKDLTAKEVSIGGLHFHTRQAIQATLATILATILGTWVSTDRWYWASLSAYVVFAGATRGENLRRAGHRLLGTVCGVVAGMMLATLLTGHRDLEIAAVFVTLFLGIHSVRAAYSWITFWFTALVALFYSLLGLLTTEILYLRFEQTLIGAGCGALMAMLVLPVSTRETLKLELAKLLRILSAILTDVGQMNLPRRERRDRVRILERELEDLRKVAGPLNGPLGGTNRTETRFIVHAGARIVHYARTLIVFFPDQAEDEMSKDVRAAILPLAERIEVLAEKIEEISTLGTAADKSFSWTEYDQTPDKDAATYSLTRLNQAINALEVRLQNLS